MKRSRQLTLKEQLAPKPAKITKYHHPQEYQISLCNQWHFKCRHVECRPRTPNLLLDLPIEIRAIIRTMAAEYGVGLNYEKGGAVTRVMMQRTCRLLARDDPGLILPELIEKERRKGRLPVEHPFFRPFINATLHWLSPVYWPEVRAVVNMRFLTSDKHFKSNNRIPYDFPLFKRIQPEEDQFSIGIFIDTQLILATNYDIFDDYSDYGGVPEGIYWYQFKFQPAEKYSSYVCNLFGLEVSTINWSYRLRWCLNDITRDMPL